MAQPTNEHTDNKRQREARQFVKQLLDELLANELDARVALSQVNVSPEDKPSVNASNKEKSEFGEM